MNSEIGKGVMSMSKDYVHKNIEKVNFQKLKPYFKITNKYILAKIILILFPFNKTSWSKENEKLQSPDLYIPLMSFLTFILLNGILLGVKSQFTPEKLTILFTRCLTYEFIFAILVKLTGYFFDINEIGFLDFLSFSGYKYVVVMLLMVRIKYLRIFYMVYLYSAFFFFLSRCLKRCVFSSHGHRRRKIYFLFITVFLEVFLVFLLAWINLNFDF